jgi:hypothetical protein
MRLPWLAAAVEGDVLEALGLAKHGADRDHQDVEQLVLDPGLTHVINSLKATLDRGQAAIVTGDDEAS